MLTFQDSCPLQLMKQMTFDIWLDLFLILPFLLSVKINNSIFHCQAFFKVTYINYKVVVVVEKE